jgi:hypothetical protein
MAKDFRLWILVGVLVLVSWVVMTQYVMPP